MVLELPIQVSLDAVLLWTQSLTAGPGVDSPSCDRIYHLLLAHTLDTYRETVKQLVGWAFFCLHLQLESCFVLCWRSSWGWDMLPLSTPASGAMWWGCAV